MAHRLPCTSTTQSIACSSPALYIDHTVHRLRIACIFIASTSLVYHLLIASYTLPAHRPYIIAHRLLIVCSLLDIAGSWPALVYNMHIAYTLLGMQALCECSRITHGPDAYLCDGLDVLHHEENDLVS